MENMFSTSENTKKNVITENFLLSDENEVCQEIVEEVLNNILSEVNISNNLVPKFGLHSMLLESMPVRVFDNHHFRDELTAAGKGGLFETAFTDGFNIFISADMIRSFFKEDENETLTKDEIVDRAYNAIYFLILHEVSHPLYMHFSRLKAPDVIPHLANIAKDISINGGLRIDYVDPYHDASTIMKKIKDENPDVEYKSIYTTPLHPLPESLKQYHNEDEDKLEYYPAMGDEDFFNYFGKTEEEIYSMLLEELQNEMQQNQSGDGPSGPGMPGQGGKSSGNGSAKPGSNADQSAGGIGTDHEITQEELAEILRKAGLDHVVDALRISEDGDEVEQKYEEKLAEIIDKTTKMGQISNNVEASGGRVPGKNTLNAAEKLVKKLAQPKISWKLTVKEAIIGSGMKYTQTYDLPSDIYHFDLNEFGLPDPIYDGAFVPSKPSSFCVALLDTSLSMDMSSDIHEACSEIFGLVENNDNAPEVLVFCSDVAQAGEPVLLTRETYDEVLKEFSVQGRGGTDLAQGINDALQHPAVLRRIEQKRQIESMMFFTDLGDQPPMLHELDQKRLPSNFYYMAVPGTYNEGFASAVSDYAKTISMGQKQEIDFTIKTRAPKF